MNGGTLALIAMGAVVLVAVFIVYRAMRASSRAGAAEANEDAARRQVDALKADQERADEIERKADLARRAPAGGQPLADRLRASGRGRKTKP